MALYFKDIEITNIDNLVPQTGLDITDIWFGSTNIYTVWQVYEGTLPATINANGTDMKQYRVYGATGGVGTWDDTEQNYKLDMCVKSGNIFDKSSAVVYNAYISTGDIWANSANAKSIKIRIEPSTTYTISTFKVLSVFRIAESDDENVEPSSSSIVTGVIRLTNATNSTFTTTANAKTLIFQGDNNNYQDWINSLMIKKGNVMPTKYQPYSNTTTPIYIGDTPLGKDEYVDYQSGKVYRRTVNEFDKDNTEIYNAYINVSVDRWLPAEDGSQSVIMQCSPSTEYTLSVPSELSIFRIAESSNGSITPSGGSTSVINVIINSTNSKYTFTTSQDTQCLIFQGNAALVDKWFNGLMLVKGDTATETYTPYLQPTDPPVPLPALPTCEGETVVDYAGQSVAPEKVILRYRKEGF